MGVPRFVQWLRDGKVGDERGPVLRLKRLSKPAEMRIRKWTLWIAYSRYPEVYRPLVEREPWGPEYLEHKDGEDEKERRREFKNTWMEQRRKRNKDLQLARLERQQWREERRPCIECGKPRLEWCRQFMSGWGRRFCSPICGSRWHGKNRVSVARTKEEQKWLEAKIAFRQLRRAQYLKTEGRDREASTLLSEVSQVLQTSSS